MITFLGYNLTASLLFLFFEECPLSFSLSIYDIAFLAWRLIGKYSPHRSVSMRGNLRYAVPEARAYHQATTKPRVKIRPRRSGLFAP